MACSALPFREQESAKLCILHLVKLYMWIDTFLENYVEKGSAGVITAV